MDLISLIKELLENVLVRNIDITVELNNADDINTLARFCGEQGYQFDVYEVWEKLEVKRLVRIRR